MIVRLSQKLARKLKERDLSVVPVHENPYLDWHAHLFTHRRSQYIMVTNCASLFSVFMHGAGVTNISRFYDNFSANLHGILRELNADLIYQRIIAPVAGNICPAKAQDRKIIGTMNEIVFESKYTLDMVNISPYDLSFKINENNMRLIKYKTPREMFMGMRVE